MEKQHSGCPKPTPQELRDRWDQWMQAMELSNAMLMAGLRAQVGRDGDIHAAYRAWYDKYQALKWQNAVVSKSIQDPQDAS